VSVSFEWVLLAYRLPREPSTPRITVWRKLKRLGVAQLLDGLVALPADAQTREQLDWIADEVIAAGGTATVWLGRPGSASQQRAIAAAMSSAIDEEYAVITAEASDALALDPVDRRRVFTRLGRELQRVARRDHFPTAAGSRAKRAVRALGQLVEASR